MLALFGFSYYNTFCREKDGFTDFVKYFQNEDTVNYASSQHPNYKHRFEFIEREQKTSDNVASSHSSKREIGIYLRLQMQRSRRFQVTAPLLLLTSRPIE